MKLGKTKDIHERSILMFEDLFELILPFFIKILESMGIFILLVGTFSAFYKYIKCLIKKENPSIKYDLANSLVTALDFKLGAEILKTVIIKDLGELIIVGTIFILRVIMTFVLEREIKIEESENQRNTKKESIK